MKEGEQPELPASSCESLIRMANLQLFENERLKDTIRELSASLKAAEQRLQTLSLLQSKLNETASPTEQGRRLEEL